MTMTFKNIFIIGTCVFTSSVVGLSDMIVLKAHNDERMMLGENPLVWDDQLAIDSMNYAAMCKKEHSMINKIGENLFWGMPLMPMENALNMWIGEKDNLMPDGKTCMDDKVCGHYLQIVNKKNIKVGCGTSICWDNYNMHVCRFSRQEPCGSMCNDKGGNKERKMCRRKCNRAKRMDEPVPLPMLINAIP